MNVQSNPRSGAGRSALCILAVTIVAAIAMPGAAWACQWYAPWQPGAGGMDDCNLQPDQGRGPRFGAIAVSGDVTGHSFNFGSRAGAEARALAECRKRIAKGAHDCEIATRFVNACGAVARASDGTWEGRWGTSTTVASRTALAGCTRRGGTDCRILSAVCSG